MKTITYTLFGFVIMVPFIASACFSDIDTGYGMMGYGYSGYGTHFLMAFAGIVWTAVGILAGVWLWQNINKK